MNRGCVCVSWQTEGSHRARTQVNRKRGLPAASLERFSTLLLSHLGNKTTTAAKWILNTTHTGTTTLSNLLVISQCTSKKKNSLDSQITVGITFAQSISISNTYLYLNMSLFVFDNVSENIRPQRRVRTGNKKPNQANHVFHTNVPHSHLQEKLLAHTHMHAYTLYPKESECVRQAILIDVKGP